MSTETGLPNHPPDLQRVNNQLHSTRLQLHRILEHTDAVLTVIDRKGTVTALEGKALEVLHLQPEDIVGLSVDELSAIQFPFDHNSFERAYHGEESNAILQAGNGQYYELIYMPSYNEAGNLEHVINLLFIKSHQIERKSDAGWSFATTEMQELEKSPTSNLVSDEIEQERLWLLAAVDLSPSGIVFIDPNGTVNLIDTKTGMQPISYAALVSNPGCQGTLRHSNGSQFLAQELPLANALHGNVRKDIKVTVAYEKGSERTLLVNAAPVNDSAGIICGAMAAVIDITEMTKAGDALRQNQQELLGIIDSISDGFLAISKDWTFKYINQRAAHNGNREPDDLIGKNIWEEFPNLRGTILEKHYYEVMEARKPVHFNWDTGYGIWYDVSVYPSDSGIAVYWIEKTEQMKSVVERDRLLAELQQSHQAVEKAAMEARHTAREAISSASQLEAILNSLTDAVIVYDPEGVVQRANSFTVAMFGFDPLRMNHKNLIRRLKVTGADGKPMEPGEMPYRLASKGELVLNLPLTLVNPRGRKYQILASALPLYLGKEFIGVVSVWNDITELRRLQHEQIQHEAQVTVQRELIQHREMERSEIARDLHDGPLQDLIATSYALVDAMGVENKKERLQKMRNIQEALQKNIRDLRTFTNDLRPPVLAPFGLEKTIRSHSEILQKKHPDIRISVELTPDGKRLPNETRMALYRVYQEAINNILKHANAKKVKIFLHLNEKEVTLTITDDGTGFQVPTNWVDVARQGHLGLIGMRERVESIGGRIFYTSSPGDGTRIEATVPL